MDHQNDPGAAVRRARGKLSGTLRLTTLAAFACTVFGTTPAFAQLACIDSSGSSQGATAAVSNDTACGQNATANGQGTSVTGYATALGAGSNAAMNRNTAIGGNASAGANATGNGTSEMNTALGYGAMASPSPSNGFGGATALGAGATASGLGSTALGVNATASGQSAIVIGNGQALGLDGVSMGQGAYAGYNNALALGTQATASFNGDIALGNGASTNNANFAGGNIAIGTSVAGTFGLGGGAGAQATGGGAVAIGTATLASGARSVSLGNASTATGSDGVALGDAATSSAAGALALGASATAANANDVALGTGSVTAVPHTGTTALYGGTAAGSAASVVSVGAAGSERQIQNVAPGVISAASTDAVNGSQLHTVQQGVNALGASTASALGGGSTFSTTTGQLSAPSYPVYGASYTNVAGAIAALQSGAAVQYTASAGSTTPLAAGSAPTDSVTLVGSGGASSNTAPVTLSNVAAGVNATDAVNVSQLDTALANASTHYFSVNDGGTSGANYANNGATGTDALAAGVGATAAGVSATAIGANASATSANDVALGAGSVAAASDAGTTALYGGTAAGTATSVVSVGAAGSERQIRNVAPGVISAASTDAINGSQLYSISQGINSLGASSASALGGGAAYSATTGVFTLPSYTIQGSTYSSVGAALAGLNTAVTTAQSTANQALSIAQNSVQYDPSQAGTGGGTTSGSTGSTGVTLNPGGAAAGVHNLAPGTVSAASTDAVNGSQLYTTNQNVTAAQGTASAAQSSANTALGLARNSVQYDSASRTDVTLNPGGTVVGLHNVAAGTLSAGSTDAVNGSQLYATNQNVSNLTNQITTGTIGLVQQQGGSGAPVTIGAQTGGSQVNVAGTSGDRRISGVAAGVANDDAVNVGQLNQSVQQAGSSAVSQANAYTSQQVSGLGRRLDAVGAEAMAASSLIPNARAEGNVQLAAAAGTYGGATALAVGANAWLSDRLLVNAHVTQSTGSGGRFGASVGATYGF